MAFLLCALCAVVTGMGGLSSASRLAMGEGREVAEKVLAS